MTILRPFSINRRTLSSLSLVTHCETMSNLLIEVPDSSRPGG